MITEETARKQLETLHQEGTALVIALAEEKETEPFEVGYQRWYSRTLPLMKQLAPERYAEFQVYYHGDPKRFWALSGCYAIQDYILGRESSADAFDSREEAARCLTSQLAILKSVADRIPWMALDTEDQAARGLQLAELEAARDLIKVSERAAGALAGVVLTAHLRKLAAKHQVKLRKQAPTAGELVEALKAARVLDVPAWSQATWLAQIRERVTAKEGGNADFAGAKICPKTEGEAPTKLQVRDLVDGTQWLITNVF